MHNRRWGPVVASLLVLGLAALTTQDDDRGARTGFSGTHNGFLRRLSSKLKEYWASRGNDVLERKATVSKQPGYGPFDPRRPGDLSRARSRKLIRHRLRARSPISHNMATPMRSPSTISRWNQLMSGVIGLKQTKGLKFRSDMRRMVEWAPHPCHLSSISQLARQPGGLAGG